MSSVTTTFIIPEYISAGLSSGLYERVGGIIRQADSKQIVAWLREGGTKSIVDGPFPVNPLVSTTSLLTLGIATVSFAVIVARLHRIQKSLVVMQKSLEKIDRKIDLGYLAKFQTATELAINALVMDKVDNRYVRG